jgi:hypothetical protein
MPEAEGPSIIFLRKLAGRLFQHSFLCMHLLMLGEYWINAGNSHLQGWSSKTVSLIFITVLLNASVKIRRRLYDWQTDHIKRVESGESIALR